LVLLLLVEVMVAVVVISVLQFQMVDLVDREVVVAAGPMASILLITAGAPLVGGMLLLPLILSGPGKLSVDHWLRLRLLRNKRRLWP
jgi:uncharacterized membrane protein YphA (DoxX/SURF4 family)